MATLGTAFATVLLFSTAYSATQPLNGAIDQSGQTRGSRMLDVLQNTDEASKQDSAKTKRSYGYNTYNQFDYQPYQPLPSWQPQYYQLNRPYFIPVFGSPGRQQIFYAPQPLFPNGGYPKDNPPKGSLPPANHYLPPDNKPCNNTTTPTDTRYNEPVWEITNGTMTDRPVVPTRRPSPGATTPPPLIHNDKDVSNAQVPQNQVGGGNNRVPSTTTQQPVAQGPSRCIWAVISCCSANTINYSYSCFETLDCHGSFWDVNPCNSDFARSAIDSVMNYYNAK